MKAMRIAATTAIIFLLANWGSEESSVEGRKKPSVNFYGTLTAYDENDKAGKEYKVENITVSRLYKQIEIYDMPITAAQATSFDLEKDPTKGVKTFVDLSEVSEITVPNPEIVWKYHKEKNDRYIKY